MAANCGKMAAAAASGCTLAPSTARDDICLLRCLCCCAGALRMRMAACLLVARNGCNGRSPAKWRGPSCHLQARRRSPDPSPTNNLPQDRATGRLPRAHRRMRRLPRAHRRMRRMPRAHRCGGSPRQDGNGRERAKGPTDLGPPHLQLPPAEEENPAPEKRPNSQIHFAISYPGTLPPLLFRPPTFPSGP